MDFGGLSSGVQNSEKSISLSVLRTEVTHSLGSHDQHRIMERAPSVFWELFVDNAPKQKGALPYADWCDF